MKMSTKIPAFTLFELILGMLLSAIVIGMVYGAWFLFMKVYTRYTENAMAQSELQVFKRVLGADVEKAALLRIIEGDLVLLDTGGRDWLRYHVGTDEVIRLQDRIADTFKLSQVMLQPFFEGKAIVEGDVVEEDPAIVQVLVDELQFRFVFAERPVLFSVWKQYSAQQLFKTHDINNAMTFKSK